MGYICGCPRFSGSFSFFWWGGVCFHGNRIHSYACRRSGHQGENVRWRSIFFNHSSNHSARNFLLFQYFSAFQYQWFQTWFQLDLSQHFCVSHTQEQAFCPRKRPLCSRRRIYHPLFIRVCWNSCRLCPERRRRASSSTMPRPTPLPLSSPPNDPSVFPWTDWVAGYLWDRVSTFMYSLCWGPEHCTCCSLLLISTPEFNSIAITCTRQWCKLFESFKFNFR